MLVLVELCSSLWGEAISLVEELQTAGKVLELFVVEVINIFKVSVEGMEEA